jgi:hypothetical protein
LQNDDGNSERNFLSYVDDIVMASKKKTTYISNLAETFANMHEARLKLNPEKCIFVVTRVNVLGCLVSMKGIKANPDKIRAIIQMQAPQNRKEMQKLTGQIVALNSSIEQIYSKATRKKPPILQCAQGLHKSRVEVEQQKAFKVLKLYLEHLPTLSSLEQGLSLILYVSATYSVVSGALVIEKETTRDGKIAKQQFPVYFVSEVLTGSKKYCSKMEKICYAVITNAKKLQHYFEAHTIKVLTNQPLNDNFSKRNNSGRISKWAIELSEYVADFKKRRAIKSQNK